MRTIPEFTFVNGVKIELTKRQQAKIRIQLKKWDQEADSFRSVLIAFGFKEKKGKSIYGHEFTYFENKDHFAEVMSDYTWIVGPSFKGRRYYPGCSFSDPSRLAEAISNKIQ